MLLAASQAPHWTYWVPLFVAVIAGSVAAAVAIYNQASSRQDRRRAAYGQAYRAAVEWTELLWRVRRREVGGEHDLARLFHAAQEAINFHRGWIRSEDEGMAVSYCRFVDQVKKASLPLIQDAWKEPVPYRPWEHGVSPCATSEPDIGAAEDEFFLALAKHLHPVKSWWKEAS